MRSLGPMAILVAAVAAASAFFATQVVVGAPPSETVQVLTSFALALAFVLWVTVDAQTRRRTPCYDFGFLVAVFFPASVVWYVLWSRGLRGLLTLCGLVGLWLLPMVCASVAGIIRHGAP
jgi:hypothetical protein